MGATAGATSESTVERLGGRAAGWASCRSGSVRHGAIERTCTGAGDAGRRAMPPPPRASSRAVARTMSRAAESCLAWARVSAVQPSIGIGAFREAMRRRASRAGRATPRALFA
ncbi:hypothetical protein [Burkholderia pseudomallei]|uniref:hypothetical protein n=1 Tax=Burkholderia pseudomallei TaxID=28450 RepID=UPI00059D9AA0|nr:hypothetical protein [Burkholderia pseudomallei]OMS83276.1 hypothetical protein AQ748_19100 [Burkholderia pseudomallei]OMW57792.1 hypothetical protein AQ812_10875 [Burkholderia pseudomallei]OMW79886.1 hypothetical protein AQ814_03055 [Burkholderia pseudomallei]OMW96377.1 hypothetical protein AQ818_20890 [Burkholderia pseudomallei]OMW98860.1 hypothetical protein AQ820_25440 [Burkholderia pseudomallei]